MIIKLSVEDIKEAVLEYVDRRVNTDSQEHEFNTVEFKYSTPWDGCEVSSVDPETKPEAT